MLTTSFSSEAAFPNEDGDGSRSDTEDDIGLVGGRSIGKRHPWLGKVFFFLRLYWRSIVIIGVPLVLLPLAVGTQEAKAGYVILLVALFWVTEVAPLAAVALIPLVMFPMLGVLTAQQASTSYVQDANFLFIGGLIVAVAVERWKLHERMALRVLLLVGVSKGRLLLGFMGITAFLSMWISNTASTAMMLPIAQAVIDELEANPEEEKTERTPVFLDQPERGAASPATPEPDQHAGPAAALAQQGPAPSGPPAKDTQFRKGMMLAVAYGASIGGVATLTGTGPNIVLEGVMRTLFPLYNGISFGKWFALGFPTVILLGSLAWLWLSFLYDRTGSPLRRLFRAIDKRLCHRNGYDVRPVANQCQNRNGVSAMIRSQYDALGPLSFAEVVVMVNFSLLVLSWFFRHPGFFDGWDTVFKKTDTVPPRSYVSDSTAAMFFSVVMFFLPSKWPFAPGVRTSMKPIERILDWKSVHDKMPWGIILLLGGGFCIAEGALRSNLSCWFGLQLSGLSNLDVRVVAFVTSVFITFFTEVASNTASATIFLPLLAQLAAGTLRQNPLWLMIPATISCSFAYMLPAATPPNAIAFSYGHLKVTDMVKSGIVMNFIGILVVVFMTNTVARPLFDLDQFPAWAMNSTQANSCGAAVNITST